MKSGAGFLVLISIVRLSIAFMLSITATLPEKGAGLLGISLARVSEKITSSDVSGLPSWNLTPSRSLICHVTGSTLVQDTASAGSILIAGSVCTRRSKTCMAMFWLLPVRENCGSIADGSVALPRIRSAA